MEGLTGDPGHFSGGIVIVFVKHVLAVFGHIIPFLSHFFWTQQHCLGKKGWIVTLTQCVS